MPPLNAGNSAHSAHSAREFVVQAGGITMSVSTKEVPPCDKKERTVAMKE